MKKNILFLILISNINVSAQCWNKISAGGYHTLAIDVDGKLWAWGANYNGELGDGTVILRNTPALINSSVWQEVSCNGSFSLGLKTDGTLWSWGYNGAGQLGDDTVIEKHTPSQVGAESNWLHIAAGNNHSTAIKSDGTLWTWGSNEFGQLGDGSTNPANVYPTQIGFDTDWQQVYASAYNTFAIKQNGTLWGWGRNDVGQLGDGTTINKNIPVQIGVDTNWSEISVGTYFTVGIKTGGSLWAWGDNFYGQLGDGTNIEKHVPTQIGVSTDWKMISSGPEHTIAQKVNGTIYAWGNGQYGSLGTGTDINYNQPTPISITNVRSISCGSYYSLIVKNDDKIWASGYNFLGQFGNGATTSSYIFMEIACPTTLSTTNLNENTNTFKVFPNPTKDFLTIRNSEHIAINRIIITDLTGKKVLEQNDNSAQIKIEPLQTGMYLLQIISDGKKSVTKFIKS